MEEKSDFWQNLDGLIESVSKQERIVLGADLNFHPLNIENKEIMGSYGAGTKNNGIDGCGFCQEDGFGRCQHLFQEEGQTHGDV